MSTGSEQSDDVTGGAGGQGPPAQWVRAFQQLFDPHPSHVALLRLDGTVLAVNTAWRRYGQVNGLAAEYEAVGQNYLAVCEAGVAANYPGAREAYVGLLEVLQNARPKFTLMYSCHTPAQREWYRLWVEPQTPSVAAVIVAHQLVSVKPWATDDPPGMGLGPGTGERSPVFDAWPFLHRGLPTR